MPAYDIVFLLKKMERNTLKSALLRSAQYILESGGTLKKMENHGFRPTPFRINKYGATTQHGAHYFIFSYYAGINENKLIKDKFERDLDVMRSTIVLDELVPGGPIVEVPKPECTLYQDLLPAPYRPSVLKLLEIAEKKKKKAGQGKKFQYNSGLDYDPF